MAVLARHASRAAMHSHGQVRRNMPRLHYLPMCPSSMAPPPRPRSPCRVQRAPAVGCPTSGRSWPGAASASWSVWPVGHRRGCVLPPRQLTRKPLCRLRGTRSQTEETPPLAWSQPSVWSRRGPGSHGPACSNNARAPEPQLELNPGLSRCLLGRGQLPSVGGPSSTGRNSR